MKTFLALMFAASTALAGSLPILKYRALDNDGEPVSGAKLYFYEAGTTTPTATYSDEALSSANANPVVADSNGWFGEIYMQTDQEYKVVMKSSDGATTYFTVDNINAGQLVSSAFQTRLQQAATNPIDQGAVGDGAADEHTEVQAAIDAATGVVDLLGKTYRCDTSLLVDSGQNGVVIKNGVFDFSNVEANYGVYVQGTLGAINLLTSSPSIGDTSIGVTTASGLAADDILLVSSSDTFASGITRGEVVQIQSLAGEVVTIKAPLEAGYATGNSASAREITPAKQIRFENVKFIGDPASGNNGYGVYISYAHNISFDHCTFENFKAGAITVANAALGLSVTNSTFITTSATGAALVTTGAVQDIKFANNTLGGMGAGVSLGESGNFQTRRALISGNVMHGVTQGVIGGVSTQYVDVFNNEIVGDTSGTETTGALVYILAPDFRVDGNVIRESGGTGIYVSTDDMTHFSGKDLSGSITNNKIWESDNAGINVVAALTSPFMYHMLIDGNQIYGGLDGIIADHVELMISNNIVRDVTNDGITVSLTGASAGISVVNNRVNNPGDSGIILLAAGVVMAHVVVAGNIVDEVDDANDICLKLETSGNGYIEYSSIVGNVFVRADDLDDNIQLNGVGPGDVLFLTIAGNTLFNGAYGIGEPTDANNTNIQSEGNQFLSIATGEHEGTVTSGTHVKSTANTACDTTCGNDTCAVGYDDGVPAVVVCTDATADHCVCYP